MQNLHSISLYHIVAFISPLKREGFPLRLLRGLEFNFSTLEQADGNLKLQEHEVHELFECHESETASFTLGIHSCCVIRDTSLEVFLSILVQEFTMCVTKLPCFYVIIEGQKRQGMQIDVERAGKCGNMVTGLKFFGFACICGDRLFVNLGSSLRLSRPRGPLFPFLRCTHPNAGRV